MALFSMLIFTSSYAGTIDPSTPDEKYRIYGEEHGCVVRLKGRCFCKKEKGKEHDFVASAVVIKPHWVITAAHVVKETKNVVVNVGKKNYEIKKIIVKDGYDEDIIGLNDIAVAYSEEDFGLDFYPELYSEKDEVGKVASICGYGLTGTFSSGAVRSDDNKRAGSNIVDRIDRNCLVCTNMGGKKTKLEFLIASGDSGGGLFIDQKLAGINSFVMSDDEGPNSDYGDECAHTRISQYLDWILEQTGSAER
jgi:hypothetical protein